MLVVLGCGQFASFLDGGEASYVEIADPERPGDSVRIPVDTDSLQALIGLAARNGAIRRNSSERAVHVPEQRDDGQFDGGDVDDDFSPFGPTEE